MIAKRFAELHLSTAHCLTNRVMEIDLLNLMVQINFSKIILISVECCHPKVFIAEKMEVTNF